MPLPALPHFVAPHFIEFEGGAGVAGRIRRGCAFTTAAPGWSRNNEGASHYHRCTLVSSPTGWDAGLVGWRTESWPLAPQEPTPLLIRQPCRSVAEGQAGDLMQAVAAALTAAHAAGAMQGDPDKVAKGVAPAFIEMRREAGLPQIWASSHLYAQGDLSAEQPWTHLRTIFVREWPGRQKPGLYQCDVETLPFSSMPSAQVSPEVPARTRLLWWADCLDSAMRGALQTFHEADPGARRLGLGAEEQDRGTG